MDAYSQDETGQWWYTNPRRGNRMRVSPQECQQCGKQFINRHPAKFCSKACTGISQRGNRLGDRPCAWCGTPFTPTGRGNRKKCCSHACAVALGNSKRGRKGPANARWKGGTRSGPAGYLREWEPNRGYVLQHRLVMEKILGRPLERYEQVHHLNGQRADNRPENLELWITRQPPGQRPQDLVQYARWILERYGP